MDNEIQYLVTITYYNHLQIIYFLCIYCCFGEDWQTTVTKENVISPINSCVAQ